MNTCPSVTDSMVSGMEVAGAGGVGDGGEGGGGSGGDSSRGEGVGEGEEGGEDGGNSVLGDCWVQPVRAVATSKNKTRPATRLLNMSSLH